MVYIGYIFGIILILVILFNKNVYKKWSMYNRLRIVVVTICIIIFGLVFGIRFYSLNTGLTKQEIIHILFNSNDNSIDYIKIYPSKTTACIKKLSRDTLIIDNKTIIAVFNSKLKRSRKVLLSHPRCYWESIIQIHYLNGVVIQIKSQQSTDNENGFFIKPYKRAYFGRFPLGVYKNDELGELLIRFYEDDNQAQVVLPHMP